MRERHVNAKLHRVSSHNLGHVVAVRVDGVGVIPWEVSGVRTKTAPVGNVVAQRECWELSPLTVVKKDAHRERGRKRRVVKSRKKNVIRSVAGHKLIEQRWRDVCIQAGHKARAWADELGIDILEAGTVAPERILGLRLPGIMDITEC